MTRTVLIVEDSPTEMQLEIAALQSLNCKLVTATDATTALNQITQKQPDVIVLDIVLPDQNGFQLCRQIKNNPATSGIKVILLSSKNQPTDKFWGMKQGADVYLTKPFDDDELRNAVKAYL